MCKRGVGSLLSLLLNVGGMFAPSHERKLREATAAAPVINFKKQEVCMRFLTCLPMFIYTIPTRVYVPLDRFFVRIRKCSHTMCPDAASLH